MVPSVYYRRFDDWVVRHVVPDYTMYILMNGKYRPIPSAAFTILTEWLGHFYVYYIRDQFLILAGTPETRQYTPDVTETFDNTPLTTSEVIEFVQEWFLKHVPDQNVRPKPPQSVAKRLEDMMNCARLTIHNIQMLTRLQNVLNGNDRPRWVITHDDCNPGKSVSACRMAPKTADDFAERRAFMRVSKILPRDVVEQYDERGREAVESR